MVRPKKHLGQHFLTDKRIAERIVNSLHAENLKEVVEIGPGTGVLTQFLLERDFTLYAVEVDQESVEFLKNNFRALSNRIFEKDFLAFNLSEKFKGDIGIIGNFPYNISGQILFKVLEHKHTVKELVGMFQKEVAKRVCSEPGSKVYGILSVLLQAFYDVEYLFTVNEGVFRPPPKVKSGVIRLVRKENYTIDCDEKMFFRVVKTAFNQRRKTIRNSLKSISGNKKTEHELMGKRPEQLTFKEFVFLTNMLSD